MIQRIILTLLGFALVPVATAEDNYAGSYLNDKLTAYKNKIEECNKIKEDKALPSEKVLHKLNHYDDQILRKFILSRSRLVMYDCYQPELAQLSFTISILKDDKTVSQKVNKKANETAELIHGVIWSMHQTYHDLPDSLKAELGEAAYFNEPFNGFDILEKLGAL